MKLFNVSCEIIIDAQSAEDAMQKIRYFLSGDYDVDINFLVHGAEADESFENIEALRNHQAIEHRLAADGVCPNCGGLGYVMLNDGNMYCNICKTPRR